ncbi:cytochrome P450 [Mycena rosella]|uniref:Cytochrome P450 n=1 Tax=Mycena rosella TaxID=1033263 RepID=A0AAD7DIW7_MYCRO|nr:cytochrome P450 [Mycena rosella]
MTYSATAILPFLVPLGLVLFSTIRQQRSIQRIPGPPPSSWLLGNMLQLFLPPYGYYDDIWRKTYGTVYRFQGCFGRDRLMISDPLALQHILNSGEFEFAPIFDTLFRWLFGERNMAVLKGEEHRNLRTAWNAAFTAGAVRQYQPILEKVAQGISEKLDPSDSPAIDICPLISSATVGSTTEVVFGCAVDDLGAEFVESNSNIMASSASQSSAQILIDEFGGLLPSWLFRRTIYLPTKASQALRTHVELASREGWRLVHEKMDAAKQGLDGGDDVYSMLCEYICAFTNKSLRPEDIVAQTSVMMIGGSDTTAYTLVWALVELAKNPELQDSLRAEIHGRPRTSRGDVAYDSMPLLNATIKESLRMYPVRPWTYRVATKDTFIPLSQSILSTNGERLSQIQVKKGQLVTLGFASYQKLESRWGEDSGQFNPGRWLESRVPQSAAIGPYANLLAFSGGSHTCVGWRLAVLEMQVILSELIDKFAFSLPVEESIEPRYMTNLMPTNADGQKRAAFCVKRVL